MLLTVVASDAIKSKQNSTITLLLSLFFFVSNVNWKKNLPNESIWTIWSVKLGALRGKAYRIERPAAGPFSNMYCFNSFGVFDKSDIVPKWYMIGKDCQGASKTMVGYMFSSFLQLAFESHDLSQAEKEITLFKAKQIHKLATFFYSKWQLF